MFPILLILVGLLIFGLLMYNVVSKLNQDKNKKPKAENQKDSDFQQKKTSSEKPISTFERGQHPIADFTDDEIKELELKLIEEPNTESEETRTPIEKAYEDLQENFYGGNGPNKDEIWLLEHFFCLPLQYDYAFDLLKVLISPEEIHRQDRFQQILDSLVQGKWLMGSEQRYQLRVWAFWFGKTKIQPTLKTVGPMRDSLRKIMSIKGTNCTEKHLEMFNFFQARLRAEKSFNLTKFRVMLGELYLDLGQQKKGEDMLQIALHDLEETFNKPFPETSDVYHNLALCAWRKGEYEEAKNRFEQSLKVSEAAKGKQHMDISRTYQELGKLLEFLGDYPAARDAYLLALEVSDNVFRKLAILAGLDLYLHLGDVYRKMDMQRAAKEQYRKALTVADAIPVKEPVKDFRRNCRLAAIWQRLGELDKTKLAYRELLSFANKKFGGSSDEAILVYESAGHACFEAKDYKGALEAFEKGLEELLVSRGDIHPQVADWYSNLGKVYLGLKDFEGAKKWLNRAVGINQQLEKRAFEMANNYLSLARVELNREEPKAASELVLSAIRIYEKLPSQPRIIAKYKEAQATLIQTGYGAKDLKGAGDDKSE